ncbi:unnamed protein product [Nippostrongylus brasiliensis]|uniref:Protein kinase domain-containing protein n=1 Tax=Nippostrongylus brasiliensis TaxID=27835 RepID=A0A0N4Y711_NIPBR|nr:unnamed protein product [Nippostrongylus brasiliensis]
MSAPVGTKGAVLEEVPEKSGGVNKEELAKEFEKQNELTPEKSKGIGSKESAPKKKKKVKKKRKRKIDIPREKMTPGQTVTSDAFTWKVIKLLGSGGFGDVYKVVKENNEDKHVSAT